MTTGGSDPRRAALRILKHVRAGVPFDVALGREIASLSDADRRLAHELAAGVLRNGGSLDARLGPLVPRGLSSVTPALREILRLGAYQLTQLDRIPPHAAVSTSVEAAAELGGAKAGGFVNAVLRRLGDETRRAGDMPAPTSLAVTYSHPEWLVARWLERFGPEETERLLRWNNSRPPLVLQPARASADEIAAQLAQAGIRAEPAPYGAGVLTDRGRPAELPGYAEGAFVVQDPAQALLAWFADLPADAIVYDACAAPGGKTVSLGRATGSVIAADLSAARARRLAENLRRAGSGREHAVVADARCPPVRPVDAVLLDAPCLGTGTFARHPDARGRVTSDALEKLAGEQRELLDAAAEVVQPGGLLIYATCSLEPEENEIQVDGFLIDHPEFRREAPADFPPALLSPKGDLAILPQRHGMDGAYAARLRREEAE